MSLELRKLHSAKIWRYLQFNIIRGIVRHYTADSMALLHYFSKASWIAKLPDPQGVLAKDIPSSAISSANTEVQCVLQGKEQQPAQKLSRELYAKFTTEQKPEIAKWAAENGIAATICHFAKKYPDLKESSVCTWKSAYTAEIKWKCSVGVGDLDIKALPKKKRGRPYLLGKQLEMQVRAYLVALRAHGAVVTVAVAIGCAEGIVKNKDSNLFASNG